MAGKPKDNDCYSKEKAAHSNHQRSTSMKAHHAARRAAEDAPTMMLPAPGRQESMPMPPAQKRRG